MIVFINIFKNVIDTSIYFKLYKKWYWSKYF